MQDKILYSLCWEDPELVTDSLEISKKDTVLSIASGGENLFAISLKGPKKLVAIDNNPLQIFLVKLKIAGIRSLTFRQFVEFTGFVPSYNRVLLYNKCKEKLDETTTAFWDNHLDLIRKGIVHSGKFEGYLKIFRKYILSQVLTQKQLKKYLSSASLDEQEKFFNKEWNNWRWKLLFKIFFSKTVMQLIGRKKEYFKYNQKSSISKHYFEKTRYGITKIPISNNYFIHYIFTGKIPIPFEDHPYLDEKNFDRLKSTVDNIEFVNSDILSYLQSVKASNFSKYNLSDVFEPMPQEKYESILREIWGITSNKCKICYWNNLVRRRDHDSVPEIKTDNIISNRFYKKDRVFFYSAFIVENLDKNTQ